MEREGLSSRLGFILLSAACAIGLGNVWRFPFITGKYGGAAFVLIYLGFLVFLGLPVMVAEFSVGRGSQRSAGESFDLLEPKGTKWHLHKYGALVGNTVLMMFYTTVTGWILNYLYKMIKGDFVGLTPQQVGAGFGGMLGDPTTMAVCMILVTIAGFAVCYLGVQKGVEAITKPMMLCLFALVLLLAFKSCSLEGAAKGLEYYLVPDFQRLINAGIGEAVFAAMGQAFFTLSLGIGSLAIFGSYIGKDRSLTGEAIWVIVLDTFIALTSGLVIFPACSAFGVDAGAGPVLIFITLPNIFNTMLGGQFWGGLFFLFMFFAAFSTVIAVFENIIAIVGEIWHIERKTVIRFMCPALIVLSFPVIFGFNIWSGFEPLGKGTCVLDLEDFIVSSNLLPLGSLLYILFCTTNCGWGWDNFIAEANLGNGIKFPACLKGYVSYVLPLVILAVFVQGYISIFWK